MRRCGRCGFRRFDLGVEGVCGRCEGGLMWETREQKRSEDEWRCGVRKTFPNFEVKPLDERE